ncbi:MAG: TlpA family protein disulfide reductase [Candidatus Eisenbacteria bacterium]|uniref:TlpA family protein disulfide reductase n=1 Tax=Eiseniibacteriota bacterium TaxID=2212470 RepID=A0A937X7J9_UNCEI|nr:TlpA family protein disulfide reductase [Candidatus Eisenbacteria bacterium]
MRLAGVGHGVGHRVGVGIVLCAIALMIASCGGDGRKDAGSGSSSSGAGRAEGAAASPRSAPGTEAQAQAGSSFSSTPDEGAAATGAGATPAAAATSEPVPALAPPKSAAPETAGRVEAAPDEGGPPLPALPPISERPAAPFFSVTDMAGRQITLADYRGRVALVVFWATWCRPCIMEIPHLVHLQEAYGNEGLGILGLSVDRRGIAVVKPFLQSHPEINYTIVPNGLAAADAFGGITSIPTSVLLDRSGRIIRGFVGLVPAEMLEGYVKAALREQG